MRCGIKPSQIGKVMDMVLDLNKKGVHIVPLLGGHAGIGKSQNVREWAEAQGEDFLFIDIRTAYQEAPDLKGFPTVVEVEINGKKTHTTVNAIPEMLPRTGRGVMFWDEVNRGQNSVLNALMQVLTDRRIDKAKLPDGFVQVSAVNPEDSSYEVNNMDTALKNRFHIYNVEFNMNDFIDMARRKKWDYRVVDFLGSGVWQHKVPEDLKPGEPYVAPRNFGEINKLMLAGVIDEGKEYASLSTPAIHAILGENVGSDFLKFINEIKPVSFQDIQKDKKAAFKRLSKFADKSAYRGDLVNVTVTSCLEAYESKQADDDLMMEVASLIDRDQAAAMLTEVLVKKEGLVPDGTDRLVFLRKFTDAVKKHDIEVWRALQARHINANSNASAKKAVEENAGDMLKKTKKTKKGKK